MVIVSRTLPLACCASELSAWNASWACLQCSGDLNATSPVACVALTGAVVDGHATVVADGHEMPFLGLLAAGKVRRRVVYRWHLPVHGGLHLRRLCLILIPGALRTPPRDSAHISRRQSVCCVLDAWQVRPSLNPNGCRVSWFTGHDRNVRESHSHCLHQRCRYDESCSRQSWLRRGHHDGVLMTDRGE